MAVREIIQSRELTRSLFVRDFSVRYKQSILGIVWAFLLPLLTVGLFVLLNSSGVLNISGVDIPYVAYALVGITTWNLFSVALTSATNSLVNAGGMISKINFPKSSLILSSSAISVVEFLVRLPLLIVVLIYYQIPIRFSGIFFGILALIPIFLFAVGLGFFLSIVAGVIRDITIALPIALGVLMMLTPIMYPVEGNSLLGKINLWNPFNHLINTVRDILFYGHSVPFEYWPTLLFILIIFLASWRFFYLAQSKIAERV